MMVYYAWTLRISMKGVPLEKVVKCGFAKQVYGKGRQTL